MKKILSGIIIALISFVVVFNSTVFVTKALADEQATWKVAGKFWREVVPKYVKSFKKHGREPELTRSYPHGAKPFGNN